MMVAPLIARGAAALAARAAAKNAAKKSAQKAAKSEANPEDKLLDSALVGLSGAKAAGAAGMAMGQERRRDEALSKDRAITRTEAARRKEAKERSEKKYARGGGIEVRGKTKCKIV